MVLARALNSSFGQTPETAAPFAPPSLPAPTFPSAIFNVREFGATGDGRTNDTAAINRAIDKCSSSGGGDVVFPAGTYSAASIHLKNNLRLVLDPNAIITGAKSGYDAPEPNEFDKFQDFGHSHFHNALMWGEQIENVAIIGGQINGGNIIEGDPDGRDIGDKVIAVKSGRNLRFENVTHQSGGHFVYLLNDCENVALANIAIRKSRDGVNLVGCRNVQMHDCRFTGLGDDALALKSDYALGRRIESRNIYVWNCYFETAANALQIGSETVGDFRNINIWNIRIEQASKAAIGINSNDSAVIDGVNYRDITVTGAACPVFIRITDRLRSGEATKKVGAIRNVTIANLTVTSSRRGEDGWPRTCLISGRPESRLENIRLENVKMILPGGSKVTTSDEVPYSGGGKRQLPASAFYIRHAAHLLLKKMEIQFDAADARPALIASDVSGFVLDDFRANAAPGTATLRLNKIENFSVSNSPGLKDRKGEQIQSEVE